MPSCERCEERRPVLPPASRVPARSPSWPSRAVRRPRATSSRAVGVLRDLDHMRAPSVDCRPVHSNRRSNGSASQGPRTVGERREHGVRPRVPVLRRGARSLAYSTERTSDGRRWPLTSARSMGHFDRLAIRIERAHDVRSIPTRGRARGGYRVPAGTTTSAEDSAAMLPNSSAWEFRHRRPCPPRRLGAAGCCRWPLAGPGLASTPPGSIPRANQLIDQVEPLGFPAHPTYGS